MTENRPAITVKQFAELCRMIQVINDERTLSYYLNEKQGSPEETGPKKVHREWAIHILGQLGISIQPSEDAREFFKAMGINTYP
ncbi:hypothetical protein [Streptomyces solicathayae]|uniref:Uncharacterized protein n=1 Tax=Streptomyces solicathayae TaxID=3081768 RepID=A0ABZ0LQH6_9ACTN|nr:hypothetical protein [Streptomyces sp. HUAS YS2]WOX21058.1 hypothetical protein R2D22_06510 [Streptomyces sp. HUAS YS2]